MNQIGNQDRAPALPDWAPQSAKKEYRDWEAREARETANYGEPRWNMAVMLRRLLTYPDMRGVWKTLKDAGDYKGPGVTHLDLWLHMAVRAYMGPMAEEKLSPGQRRKWIADVTRHAGALSKMLRGKRADDWLLHKKLEPMRIQQIINRVYRQGFGGVDAESSLPPYLEPHRLSELLDEFAIDLPILAKPSPLKRPKGPEARRAYFVRHMTQHCREILGKPHWRLVTVTTAAAFDQPDLTQRQVIRLGKGDTKLAKTRN